MNSYTPDYEDDDIEMSIEDQLADCGWNGEYCVDEGSEACNQCPLFALLHGNSEDGE